MRSRLSLYFEDPVGAEQGQQLLSTLESQDIQRLGEPEKFQTALETGRREQLRLSGVYKSVRYDPEYPYSIQLDAHDEGAAIVLYVANIGTTIVDTTACQLATTDKVTDLNQLQTGTVAIFGPESVAQVGRGTLLSAPALAVSERNGTIALIAGLSSQSDRIEQVDSYLAGHSLDGELRIPVELDTIPEPDWMDESGFLAAVGDWDRDPSLSFSDFPSHRYRQLMQDPDSTIRAEACWAYAHSHMDSDTDQVKAAIQTLIDECFEDSASDVRLEAMRGVRRLESQHIETPDIEAIKNSAFTDESAAVRVEAIETLWEYTWDHIPPERATKWFQRIYETDAAVGPRRDALLKLGTQAGIALVFDGLRSEEADVRQAAATILSSRVALLNHDRDYPDSDEGLTEHRSEIIDLIGHHDSDVREVAIEALGVVGADSIVSELTEQLDTADDGQRASAATALGYTQDPRAVDPLIDCLDDTSYTVRARAVSSLRNIHDEHPQAVQTSLEPLCSLLESDADELSDAHGGFQTLRELLTRTLDQIDDGSSPDS